MQAAIEQEPAEGTRRALIDAGMQMFGTYGFDGASTRAIAAQAQTNVASIAYHFGSKEGLRLACAEDYARHMRAALARAGTDQPQTPAAARDRLHRAALGIVTFLTTTPEAEKMAGFMLREMSENGPALDVIYASLVEPMHRQLCGFWGLATGRDPESEAVRLAVFALIGQIAYFRIGSPIIARRMGWTRFDATSAGAIAAVITATLDAMLAAGAAP